MIFFSLLPESPRWLMSKGKFDRGEEVLRNIAKINHRTFDEELFNRFKREQIRVSFSPANLPYKNSFSPSGYE